MTEPEPLVPTPTSDRIDASYRRLEARLPDRFLPPGTTPRIGAPTRSLHREVRDIVFAEGDPGKMLRLKVTREPRAIERPAALDDALSIVTPQFILRNTHRDTRDADPNELDQLQRRRLREPLPWDDVRDAHRCGAARADPTLEHTADKIALLVAERRVVMLDTPWHELYGRPDELEPTD